MRETTHAARLPRAPGVAAVSSPEDEGRMEGERLLLVEDEADAARHIDRAFSAAGFVVHRVPTGEQGLEYLAAHPVAGVVLDHRLPLADGLQTLRRIRERRITIPVVMISSAGSIDVAVEAIKADAFDFVEKHDGYLPRLVARMCDAIRDARRSAERRVVRAVSVGRAAERRLLADELMRASRGEGRVVLVTGDDGIGKTTLALEAERLARDAGAVVLWGRCPETGGAPAYWPWTQVLRGYERVVGPDRLRDALGPVARVLARRPADEAAPATGPEHVPFQLLDGVTQCLRAAAQDHPLLLVLDDLHHADVESLQLLRFLAGGIRDAAMLVVGTHRDTPMRKGLVELGREPFTTVVPLAGFSEAEVRAYIVEATAVVPTEGLVRAVHEKTEGHPLFVADVVRALAGDGRLAVDPAGQRIRLAIPETRRHAIDDRLGRVSPPCRRVLGTAAVIGREFDLALLERIARSGEASPAIDEAAEAGLVVGVDDEPGAYRFSHVLIRDVLYDDLPADARARLHARIARALEVASSPGAEPPLAAIAHHYFEAATGSDDVLTAIEYAALAGERAGALMAHEEAARHYEQALRAAERARSIPPGLVERLLAKLADARWRAGELADARAVGRRLLRLAKESGDASAVAAAALTFAGRLPGLGVIVCDDEVVAELEHALTGLPPTATALRSMLTARLAEELTYSPRRTADRALAPKAITLARALDEPAVLATVLRTTQWSVWTPDDVERRRQLAEEIVSLAGQTDDPTLALDGELLRFWSALEHGEMDVARRQLAVVGRLASRLNLPYYAWITAAARATFLIGAGRLDEADRVADETLGAGDPTTNPTVPLFVGAQRYHIAWHRGRFDEVARWLTGVLDEFPILASAIECSLVITYAEAGQREFAQAKLRQFAADDFAGVPRNAMWLMNMSSLAEACAALGDVDAARGLYAQLAPFARYNVMLLLTWVGAPVSHYMAGLAALLGDGAAARRHYDDALLMEARTGTRHWQARTQLAYARLLRASGSAADRERADALVAAACATAKELRLQPVLDAVATLGAVAGPPVADGHCLFRRRGDVWDVGYLRIMTTVHHRVGMEYLRRLFENADRSIPAIELASGGEGVLIESDGGYVVDGRAVAEALGRLDRVNDEIAACERGEIMACIDALHTERERLEQYVQDQGRTAVSASERARTAVTKAIDRAIADIKAVHEPLGRHLEIHVRTGRYPRYVTDPVAPLTFDL
ncbi:MAG TPA: AAA family ATPase [Candidatus Eisenbacteria bacterium]|nr:AAA family ATPase [Candidatus Eisenbacteria bacterium]